MSGRSQPWIAPAGAAVDIPLLCLPAFASTAMAFLVGRSGAAVSVGAWFFLVVAVDVAHVYATLFRTYWNPVERGRQGGLLWVVPAACWALGVLLFAMGPHWFWRVFAYVAVFHFVRQQYGFLRLYSREDTVDERRWAWLDATVLYLSAIWPLLYWHAHLPRAFHWFVDGDFVEGLSPSVAVAVGALYLVAVIAYALKESLLRRQKIGINWPKQLILSGTALSWGVGIVALDGDLAFTLTNVLSHGIPYLGLTWIYGRRQREKSPDVSAVPGIPRLTFGTLFAAWAWPLFLAILVALAYVEEGFWDALVWREREALFAPFRWAFESVDTSSWQVWVVPLLALPQATHYVLDGFIWRLRDAKAPWFSVLFPSRPSVGESA